MRYYTSCKTSSPSPGRSKEGCVNRLAAVGSLKSTYEHIRRQREPGRRSVLRKDKRGALRGNVVLWNIKGMMMENLVSANLSLLTETLVARGACCCWVEMQEICRFKPVGVAFSWVVLVGPRHPPSQPLPEPPTMVWDISRSGLDIELMGQGAAKHS